jgi:uncharacterized protein
MARRAPRPPAKERAPDKENAFVMTGKRFLVNRRRLEELCRRRHILRLAFFGSVLRDDFRPDSDIDVLVEFEAGRTPGLAFFSIERELSDIFGRRVDLNTPAFLSPRFRSRVLAEAQTEYAAP